MSTRVFETGSSTLDARVSLQASVTLAVRSPWMESTATTPGSDQFSFVIAVSTTCPRRVMTGGGLCVALAVEEADGSVLVVTLCESGLVVDVVVWTRDVDGVEAVATFVVDDDIVDVDKIEAIVTFVVEDGRIVTAVVDVLGVGTVDTTICTVSVSAATLVGMVEDAWFTSVADVASETVVTADVSVADGVVRKVVEVEEAPTSVDAGPVDVSDVHFVVVDVVFEVHFVVVDVVLVVVVAVLVVVVVGLGIVTRRVTE